MGEGKIDFFGPAFIMAIIAALMSDFAFLFLLALLIPVIGLVIALMVFIFHYFAGTLLLFLIFPSLEHLIPKGVLLLSIILPLPFLTIGIVLAVILQNRAIEFIATQAVLTAVTAATGGAAAPLQAGVTAVRIAQVTKVATTVRTAGMAVKGAEATTAVRAGSTGAKVITAEKETSLGAKAAELETGEAEKAGAKAAERGGAPEQQEPQKDTLEDRLKARKEKLNKVLEKIHEKEDQDEAKKAKEIAEREEEQM